MMYVPDKDFQDRADSDLLRLETSSYRWFHQNYNWVVDMCPSYLGVPVLSSFAA